jgi:capsular exopolysaccharide synthesis family protein
MIDQGLTVNTGPQGGMSVDRVLAVIRRRGPIVLVCMLIAGGSAFAFARHERKQFTATASLLFSNNANVAVVTGLNVASGFTQSQQDTNVKLVGLGDIAGKTAAALHNGWGPGRVRGAISVAPSGDTNIVLVNATAPSPRLAQRIANTYAQTFVAEQQAITTNQYATAERAVMDQYRALNPVAQAGVAGINLLDRANQLATLAGLDSSNVTVAGLASLPSGPSSPSVSRDTALGLIIGLLIGLGIAFLLERLDHRILDPKELERIYDLPILAAVPERSDYEVLNSLSHAGDASAPSLYDEVFNTLRAYLRYFAVDRELRTVLVISADRGEGKTTVSYNLAKSAAALGSRVLLLEADLRRGTVLGPLLGGGGGPALPDVLIGEVEMEEAIRSIEIGPDGILDVLVAGKLPPPNTGALIESRAMEALIERARAQYDLVVIDTPPMNLVGDAIPLLTKVDGAILVARTGRSRRDAAEQLRKTVSSLRAPVLGIVANAVTGSMTAGVRRSVEYGYEQRARGAASEAAVSSGGGRSEILTSDTDR